MEPSLIPSFFQPYLDPIALAVAAVVLIWVLGGLLRMLGRRFMSLASIVMCVSLALLILAVPAVIQFTTKPLLAVAKPNCDASNRTMVVSGAGLIDYGARKTNQENLTPTSLAVVNRVASIWDSQRGRIIVLTGGSAGSANVAQHMRAFLLDRGVHRAELVLEDKSLSTDEKAENVGQLFDKQKWGKSVTLVGASLPMKRTIALFEKRGFDVCPVMVESADFHAMRRSGPLPSVTSLQALKAQLVEYVELAYHRYAEKL